MCNDLFRCKQIKKALNTATTTYDRQFTGNNLQNFSQKFSVRLLLPINYPLIRSSHSSALKNNPLPRRRIRQPDALQKRCRLIAKISPPTEMQKTDDPHKNKAVKLDRVILLDCFRSGLRLQLHNITSYFLIKNS